MTKILLSLNPTLLTLVDAKVKNQGYSNRSELLREAVRNAILASSSKVLTNAHEDMDNEITHKTICDNINIPEPVRKPKDSP